MLDFLPALQLESMRTAAHPQPLFNGDPSASTLLTIDPRTSPQSPLACAPYPEHAGAVVLRLAVSNPFEGVRPEPGPVAGRLGAEVPGLPAGVQPCVVFECGPGPGGYRALGSGVMVKAATWFLRTGTEGKTQVVYVLRDQRLSQGVRKGIMLAAIAGVVRGLPGS